jgi:hypothetical protein
MEPPRNNSRILSNTETGFEESGALTWSTASRVLEADFWPVSEDSAGYS